MLRLYHERDLAVRGPVSSVGSQILLQGAAPSQPNNPGRDLYWFSFPTFALPLYNHLND